MRRVHEMPPAEYAEFHGIDLAKNAEETGGKRENVVQLLKNAPSTFWTVGLVQFFCWAAFLYMWSYLPGAVAENAWGTTDPASGEYQAAGNWVGVLCAVQAIGSLVWATFIPRFKSVRMAYVVSLLCGALGFSSIYFVHDQYLLMLSLFVVGPAWAAMLALPFTLLTNALEGTDSMGTYLGLFNCTICFPQIIAAALGGTVLSVVGSQPAMMLVSGALLVCAAISVKFIAAKK